MDVLIEEEAATPRARAATVCTEAATLCVQVRQMDAEEEAAELDKAGEHLDAEKSRKVLSHYVVTLPPCHLAT